MSNDLFYIFREILFKHFYSNTSLIHFIVCFANFGSASIQIDVLKFAESSQHHLEFLTETSASKIRNSLIEDIFMQNSLISKPTE